MNLHNLPSTNNSQKKRVGRGNASNGTYSGRGMKGQRSRSGGKSGLQLRSIKSWVAKLPKQRGFKSLNTKPEIVDIAVLDSHFETGALLTPRTIHKAGLVATAANGVKLLGTATVKNAYTCKGVQLSKTAAGKIEAAGGTILVAKQSQPATADSAK